MIELWVMMMGNDFGGNQPILGTCPKSEALNINHT
jgi:hypothetical protein